MFESKLANENQTMMASKAGSLYTQLAGPDPPASKTRLEIQANNSSLNLGPLSSLGRVSCGGRVPKGSATWRTEILWLETNSFAFDELTHLSNQHHGGVDNEEAAGPESHWHVLVLVTLALRIQHCPLVDVVAQVVDGNGGLPQHRADHRHLHARLQQHRLVLPCCVEESQVLGVDGVLGRHVAEEEWADDGEGEGEVAGAGKQQQGPDIPIGKADVVILSNRVFFSS